jgi:hypothetical protein
MGFYKGRIPLNYKTEEFTFYPLTIEHTQLDYDALMVSKSMLRDWGWSGTWPSDDFTLDDNRADLQGHADEFESGEGYAYTILNADETRVEGCFYSNSLLEIFERFGVDPSREERIKREDTLVRFWIREERLAEEAKLLEIIIAWLKTEWDFPSILFTTNDKNDRQARLFESVGMTKSLSWSHNDLTWIQYLLSY